MMINQSDTFLLQCAECGNKFFTQGEKDFYEEKNLMTPKRCKKCRDIRQERDKIVPDVKQLYKEILENWSVEARKEGKDYFYYIQEVNDIIEGKKSFVIGRKGSGKTAMAQYLYELHGPRTFSDKLSFKNFPFNILYSLENTREYTVPNQYISMWKYLIYSCLCKKMMENHFIDSEIRTKLTKLYGDSEDTSLKNLIMKWTTAGFGMQILGIGFNYERKKAEEKDVSWLDTIDILEQVILNYCDNANYFLLFDELDEDYKEFTTEIEEQNYKCMLTSLFKAVEYIRSIFDQSGKNIFPVVFLRSDIYSQLKDSDKNKWRESIIDLEWSTPKIKCMLAHRLCVAMGISEMDFEKVWHILFSYENVKMGNNQKKKIDIYSYIERSTEMRPRDFVQYIKECVSLAKENAKLPISPDIVKSADDNFSDYLKSETIDEVFSVLPEIDEILGLLSTIRKQRFNYAMFEKEYAALVMRKTIPKRDVGSVLLVLFDVGVIGNAPSMKGQSIFRFSKKAPRFNFNEPMIIHRGLYKALQIF